ncbi:MAG: hypothetical protein K2O54_07695, partial [Prevotella sp.]|nr:hypothetical protein [Prevotella sp.]
VEVVLTVSEALDLFKSGVSGITSSYTKKIEAACYAYFYYMANNGDHKSITMLKGDKFTDEYLYAYFRDYILYPEAHIHSLDTFMTAAGFADTEWIYDMIAFTSFKAFGFGYIYDFCNTHPTYDEGILDLSTSGYKNFEKFRDYYNCVLAQYFVRYKSDSMTIGQDTLNNANREISSVASPVVSTDSLRDELIAQNYLYTPKSGGTFKFGYRSENYIAKIGGNSPPVLRFYNRDLGFCEQGYNDLWFVPYLLTEDSVFMLSRYQYHIYIADWIPVDTDTTTDLNRVCIRIDTYSYLEGLEGSLLENSVTIAKSPDLSGLPRYLLLIPFWASPSP